MKRFLTYHEKLVDIYASKKKMTMMPVRINGADFQFSTGKHNGLYVGDTIEKDLVKNVDKLEKLG